MKLKKDEKYDNQLEILDGKCIRIRLKDQIFDLEAYMEINSRKNKELLKKNDDDFIESLEKNKKGLYEEGLQNTQKIELGKDKLTKIILSQKIMGFWEMKNDLIDLLGLNEEVISKSSSSEFSNRNHLWMTMIVICYLQLNFAEKSGSWALISEKAEEYLEENEINLSEYKSKIMEILASIKKI